MISVLVSLIFALRSDAFISHICEDILIRGNISDAIHFFCHKSAPCNADDFLPRLKIPRTWNTWDADNISIPPMAMNNDVVVIADRLPTLPHVAKLLEKLPRTNLLFIVPALRRERAKRLFALCLRYGIINPLVALDHTHYCDFQSMFPFLNGCWNSAPVHVLTWTNTTIVENLRDLFFPFEKKVWNLNGCTLVLSGFVQSPYTEYVLNEDNETYTNVGLTQHLLNAMVKTMNFIPKLKTIYNGPEDIGSVANKTGIYGDLYRKSTAFAVGRFTSTEDLMEAMDFTPSDGFVCYTWCLRPGARSPVLYFKFFGEFTPTVWCLLFSAPLVTAVAVCISYAVTSSFKDGPRKSPMAVAVIMLAVFTHGSRAYHRIGNRLLLSHWLMFAFLISSVYQSTFKSMMALPFKGIQVDSPEKLAYSNYKIILDNLYYDIAYEKSKGNEILKIILQRRLPCPWESSGHCLNLLAKSDVYDFATVSPIQICIYNSVTTPGMFWLSGCFENRHSHYFMLVKRSIFHDRLTSLQMKLSAAGLLGRWLDEGRVSQYSSRKVTLNKGDFRAVMLPDIVFGTAVLLSGLILSSVVFVGECIVYRMYYGWKRGLSGTALKEIPWLD